MRNLNLDARVKSPKRSIARTQQEMQAVPHGERAGNQIDLGALLHPSRAFARPADVVRDSDLTLNEKRAILASWASDACAVEAAPALRMQLGGAAVSWDEIMDALKTLDDEASRSAPYRFDAELFWWPERRKLQRRPGSSLSTGGTKFG